MLRQAAKLDAEASDLERQAAANRNHSAGIRVRAEQMQKSLRVLYSEEPGE